MRSRLQYSNNLPMSKWAEEDIPSYKILSKGKGALTDVELLSMILGGPDNLSLARKLLFKYDNNLNELARVGYYDLCKIRGIGHLKATRIMACIELGRRRQLSAVKNRQQITSSTDSYNVIGPIICDLEHEEFWVLFLNRSNRLLDTTQVSKGGTAGTVVDAKIIFRAAIQRGASSIILSHNHPSGSLKPSQNDIDITSKLKKGGENLDVTVLDHLIISENGYYSFADEGIM